MNATAHVIVDLSVRNHVKSALKEPQWLPVEQRITYKLRLLLHLIHSGQVQQLDRLRLYSFCNRKLQIQFEFD